MGERRDKPSTPSTDCRLIHSTTLTPRRSTLNIHSTNHNTNATPCTPLNLAGMGEAEAQICAFGCLMYGKKEFLIDRKSCVVSMYVTGTRTKEGRCSKLVVTAMVLR